MARNGDPAKVTGALLRGIVQSGRQEAAGFLAVPWVADQLRDKAGISPFPGTLNLKLSDPASIEAWRRIRGGTGLELISPDPRFCNAVCFPVLISGEVRGAIVLPRVEGYPADVVEVVAPERLRGRLKLEDGDPCVLEVVD